MRILSVVTLISPDGEYGGPVRVALNQASALIDSGNSVTVVAATRGYGDTPPHSISGVPVRLFPARVTVPGTGFAGLSARGMLRWIKQNARSFDIIHVHAARDLVTLPVTVWLRRQRLPYVLQTHGMIVTSRNPLAPLIDMTMTRRVLLSAKAVLYLTNKERQDLVAVAGDQIHLRPLANGVPTPTTVLTGVRPREVLYLARLAPRKRPAHFVRMAARLLERHPDVRFTLVGPDEGEGDAITRMISETGSDRIRWEGPLDPELTGRRMTEAGLYVLPSVDEPYPMSVLEAMSLGLPVVITDTCGLAEAVHGNHCGLVVDHTEGSLRRAVDRLLSDPATAARMGDAGAAAAHSHFGMGAVAEELLSVYGE